MAWVTRHPGARLGPTRFSQSPAFAPQPEPKSLENDEGHSTGPWRYVMAANGLSGGEAYVPLCVSVTRRKALNESILLP
jgi:hypothetical protein